MTKKTVLSDRAIVVCTAKRGVFFGYAPGSAQEIVEHGSVTIARARMCTYWSAPTKGVLGLAASGPKEGSRIGPAVPELACAEVTAVLVCSTEAVEAWEKGPWS